MENFKVANREWKFRSEVPAFYLWNSMWWCQDGDGAELYIAKDKGGFDLHCFSGIPASNIHLDELDFSSVWTLAKFNTKMMGHTFEERCIMLADYFCSLFCEYKDVSGYTET